MSPDVSASGPTAPIYIIGTERSGSNLLRVILNAHSGIDIPHPPHIMRYFADLEGGYGDLAQASVRTDLVNDVLRLIDTHIYPWEVDLDVERVVNEARPANLLGIFAAIYDQHLAHTGKRRWGCKSTFMVHHIQAALDRDPEARFVWIIRDPRDVAASSRKSVFSPFHPHFTARLWDDQQREGLAMEARHPSSVHRLHYERLLSDPEGTIRELCDFLGEPFEADLLAHERTAAAKKGAQLSESWENTGKPVIAGNSGKFRNELTEREIGIVESVAGPTMTTLGYAPDVADPPLPPSTLQQLGFRFNDHRWRMGVECRSLFKDDNHWRRWKRAMLMSALSMRRGSR